jgi:hypothetical protein
MRRITLLKQNDVIQLVWGSDGNATEAPTNGGRTVAPWEEIDGKLASDYGDGVYVVSAENALPPEPMASTLFLKDGARFAVLWDEKEYDGTVVDRARVLGADDLVDGKRAADYADGTHIVASSNRKEV